MLYSGGRGKLQEMALVHGVGVFHLCNVESDQFVSYQVTATYLTQAVEVLCCSCLLVVYLLVMVI